MPPTDLENQLQSLTPDGRATVLQTLIQRLGNGSRGILKTVGVCGGAACIAGTRIPVWLLVESRAQGGSGAQMLNDYRHISAAELVNV